MILARSGVALLLGASGLMAGGTGPFFAHSPVTAADLWMYPHAGSPGTNPSASVFTALPELDPSFDDRFSQFVIKFNTEAAGIQKNLGAANYDLSSVRLTCVVSEEESFYYDPTPDPLAGFGTGADSDPGRPIEVHGTGFKSPFTESTFLENSPYGVTDRGGRNAYALGYTPEGTARDVSNNFSNNFDAIPWATAKVLVPVEGGEEGEPQQWAELTPGELVPIYAHVVFDLNLSAPGVANYVRTSLNRGFIWLTVSALYGTEQMASSGYPSFFTKEDPEQALTHDVAPTLDVEYSLPVKITSFSRDSALQTAQLSWNASPGFVYKVEKTGDLTSGIWQPVDSNRTTAAPGELNWSGASLPDRTFFRVTRTPLPPP